MIFNRDKLVVEIGGRLMMLRAQFKFSAIDMARRLGLSRSGYYKQERGNTLPRLEILNALHREYDISMDWLLFNRGPMYFREKVELEGEAGSTPDKLSPHVRELIEYMEKDPLLEHEVLVQFFKYKERKENPAVPTT